MWREMRDNTVEFYFPRRLLQVKRDLYVPDGTLTLLCSVRPREQSVGGTPNSGGDRTPVIPPHRMNIGELSSETTPSLYVTWTIPRFFRLPRESTHTLESPEFPFSGRRHRLRWVQPGNRVHIHLVNLRDSDPGRYASYELGLKSTTGEEIHIDRFEFSTPRYFSTSRSDLDPKQSECFPDDRLTVFCCVGSREPSSAGRRDEEGLPEASNSVSSAVQTEILDSVSCAVQTEVSDSGTDNETLRNEDCSALDPKGLSKLQSDYKQLLLKGVETDASLVVCGKEFHAHQMILRARSTVFDAMFGHDTAERESGRVTIDDLDPDCFGHFLEYLYTGVVGDGLSDDNAFGLYEAADKYDVPTLKAECVAHMRRSLSVDSFCDFLAVALRHPEEELLPQVVTFFKENMARIIVTVKWQQFVIENGTSANELFIKAIVPPGQ